MGSAGGDDVDLGMLLDSKHGDKAQKRIAELSEEYLEETERRVREGYETDKTHDTLIDICASAFGPESELAASSGYRFLFAEPLVELGVPNFDLLLYDPEAPRTIFIECKSGIANPGTVIESLKEARVEVLQNQEYLEEAVGGSLGFIEYVLCVPAEKTNRVLRHIEQREDLGYLDDNQDDPLLLWQVNKFQDQILQLVTRARNRSDSDNQHGDPDLTNTLTDGASVTDAEVTYRGYPSSHLLRLSEEGLMHVMMQNKAEGDELREFTFDRLETFFSNPAHIPHYAHEEIGANLAEKVVERGVELGLLTYDEDSGLVTIDLDVKTIKSIHNRYLEEFLQRNAQEKARSQAEADVLEEFGEEYPSLFEFD